LARALSRPDDIVLTRRAAQQFLGRGDVAGETLEINQEHSLVPQLELVRGVLREEAERIQMPLH
jgi:hypothetical protein